MGRASTQHTRRDMAAADQVRDPDFGVHVHIDRQATHDGCALQPEQAVASATHSDAIAHTPTVVDTVPVSLQPTTDRDCQHDRAHVL
jgi:hypothetical protein